MADYIEGKRPVIEALRVGVPVRSIMIADNAERDALMKDILRKARQAGIEVLERPRRKLDERSERGSHQGVMARVAPFPYVGIGEVIEASRESFGKTGRSLVVVLDHITDAGNLGAIARSAEVVGACGLVIPNKRSACVTAGTYKSSAGAIAHLRVAQVANVSQALGRLQEEGFWIAGASEHAEGSIWDANLKGRIALVMGNEGEGLAELTRRRCDFLMALPQVGRTASLNVAQSATACMYEWLRQNLAEGGR